ncbi:MAG: hypothetical protein IT452_09870 [Planctomycetia bacterium]|nr:hypothetical protein [Planctomycetia bacterium]
MQPRRGETKSIELKVDSNPNADQFERQRQHVARLGGNSFTVMSVNCDVRTMPAVEAAALMTLLYERFSPLYESLRWDAERGKFRQSPRAPTA